MNTTLAHESGHGLLHTHLFVLGEKPISLFGDEGTNEPMIMCRDDSITGIRGVKKARYAGHWWEFQANLVIGSLLMPRSLCVSALEPFLTVRGVMRTKKLDSDKRRKAEKALSKIFDVNPIVARIRLEGLFPIADEKQLTL